MHGTAEREWNFRLRENSTDVDERSEVSTPKRARFHPFTYVQNACMPNAGLLLRDAGFARQPQPTVEARDPRDPAAAEAIAAVRGGIAGGVARSGFAQLLPARSELAVVEIAVFQRCVAAARSARGRARRALTGRARNARRAARSAVARRSTVARRAAGARTRRAGARAGAAVAGAAVAVTRAAARARATTRWRLRLVATAGRERSREHERTPGNHCT